MKRFFALFYFLLFITTVNIAQDIIITTSGDTILAKVLEVNTVEIKYKKFNLLDGPTYSESKSNIQKITYSNGRTEKFAVREFKKDSIKTTADQITKSVDSRNKIELQPYGYKYQGIRISENEMHTILLSTNDKQITDMVGYSKRAKKKQKIGFVALPLAGIGAGLLIGTNMVLSEHLLPADKIPLNIIAGVFVAGAITCPIISGVFNHNRIFSNKDAIKLFNQKY